MSRFNTMHRLRSSKRLVRWRFAWIADLLPNELANDVAAMMEQGLGVIKQTMERSAVHA
jgi:hypothetical protein